MFLYLLEVKLTNTLAVVFLFRRQNLLESKPEHWIVTELIRPLLIWDPLDPEKKDIENINTNHLLITSIHFINVDNQKVFIIESCIFIQAFWSSGCWTSEVGIVT